MLYQGFLVVGSFVCVCVFVSFCLPLHVFLNCLSRMVAWLCGIWVLCIYVMFCYFLF